VKPVVGEGKPSLDKYTVIIILITVMKMSVVINNTIDFLMFLALYLVADLSASRLTAWQSYSSVSLFMSVPQPVVLSPSCLIPAVVTAGTSGGHVV